MTALLVPLSAGVKAASPFRRFVTAFCKSRVAVAAFVVLVVVILVALSAPWIAPTDPYDLTKLNLLENRLPPGSVSDEGMTYWLGTDGQGRDILSAILYGLRISLFVATSSGLIALVLGTAAGLVAGYFGGWLDTLVMRLVDLQLSFPTILVALMLLALLGQGSDKVIIALVIVQWAYYCRTMRAAVLVERERDYMQAARCLALGHCRVMFRHLLINCTPSLIVIGTVQIAHSIALEATLSFLGLGLPPTEPSLGLLIANGYDYVLSGRYWISLYPGIALLIMLVSINLVGDQLRDVLNPRLRR